MNTTTAHARTLAARKLMRASLLTLLCAGSLLVCQRVHAVEADAELATQDAAVVETSAAAPAPHAGRLLLAVTRLGERVLRLAPWHRQATMQPVPVSMVVTADDGAALATEGSMSTREAWTLKASPDPLVALIQMSRPTLRLSGGPEISLRVLGGLGVTLRSQF